MKGWQVQVACEAYGYDGIWDVPQNKMDEVMELAEAIGG